MGISIRAKSKQISTNPVPKQPPVPDKFKLPVKVILERLPSVVNSDMGALAKKTVEFGKTLRKQPAKNYTVSKQPPVPDKFKLPVKVILERLPSVVNSDVGALSKKTVKFGQTLRKQPTKNYAEVSLDNSPTAKKIDDNEQEYKTIYSQRFPEVVTLKKTNDPFEFIDTSPKKKKQRKTFKNKDVDTTSSIVYDRSIKEALRKIRQNEYKRQKKQTVRGTNNVTKQPVKNKKIKRLEKTPNNLYVKNDKDTTVANPLRKKSININEIKNNAIKQVSNNDNLTELNSKIFGTAKRTAEISRRSTYYFEGKDEECSDYFGFDDDDRFSVFPKVSPQKLTLDNINPVSRKFISMTSTPIPKTPRRTNRRINIISNVLISPPSLFNTSSVLNISSEESKSDDFKGFDRSGPTSQNITILDESANSKNTEVGFLGYEIKKPNSRQTSCPWRLDGFVTKRNPYFLAIKDTSLPCYDQDTILNPKLLETSEIKLAEPQQNKIQTTMLDYIGTNKSQLERTPVKKARNNSLFTSPAKELQIENYFGFDTLIEENKENIKPTKKRKKRTGPTRISLTAVKEIQKEAVEKLLQDVNFDEDFELPQQASEEGQKNIPEDKAFVGLFEDLETAEQEPKTYGRKRPRRVRVVSVDSEEEKEEKPKKRKKDIRTAAEEAEYKKWVTAFNSMCEEVERHELEVA